MTHPLAPRLCSLGSASSFCLLVTQQPTQDVAPELTAMGNGPDAGPALGSASPLCRTKGCPQVCPAGKDIPGPVLPCSVWDQKLCRERGNRSGQQRTGVTRPSTAGHSPAPHAFMFTTAGF